LVLSTEELPEHAVRVMVTILENGRGEEDTLAEPGDYLGHLTDYEVRLGRMDTR
jgi:hypothetical protein